MEKQILLSKITIIINSIIRNKIKKYWTNNKLITNKNERFNSYKLKT